MDRITRLRIRQVRAIERVDLDLAGPLTVLIGENGSGKSTIIECLEILRKAADSQFTRALYEQHRGLAGLLRKGAASMALGVTLEDDGGTDAMLSYDFELEPRLAGFAVVEEVVTATADGCAPTTVLRRSRDRAEVTEEEGSTLHPLPDSALRPDQLVVASGRVPGPHATLDRLAAALAGIEVHLAFDTIASWAARRYQFSQSIRSAATLVPADRLDLLGFNLASAWMELRNRPSAEWDHILDTVRLGIGDHVDNVVVHADPSGGQVLLSLRLKGLPDPISAADLSDGQLAWLAFVALAQLGDRRSLLAVDEPELHLHPSLLGRVVSLLSNLPGTAPTLLSTHSDRVLEMLDDPAEAVRVCALEGTCARVRRIDPTGLDGWLRSFSDLGEIRAAGYLNQVLADDAATKDTP